MNRDDELCDYPSQSDVKWTPLDETSSAEVIRTWREIYGRAFVFRSRLPEEPRPNMHTSKSHVLAFSSFPLRRMSMGSRPMLLAARWEPMSAVAT